MIDSIAIVACSYRLSPEEMVGRVLQLLAGQVVAVRGFAVSAHLDQERELGDGWTALPSDNADFDFSAYFIGAEAVVARGLDDRPVLFLNDTMFTNHAAKANFRALWRQLVVLQNIELPAMAGKADPYTTICLRSPWSGLDSYVTTFCFLLNPKALALMLRLRTWAENDDVTHAHDVDEPTWGARLPGAFRQFLKGSLVYRRSPYLWYRLREGFYSPAQLRSKARCIYFEHRLSGAVGEAGCLLPSNAGPRWSAYLAFHERLHRLRRRLGL
jgi:hypothetical protein